MVSESARSSIHVGHICLLFSALPHATGSTRTFPSKCRISPPFVPVVSVSVLGTSLSYRAACGSSWITESHIHQVCEILFFLPRPSSHFYQHPSILQTSIRINLQNISFQIPAMAPQQKDSVLIISFIILFQDFPPFPN